MYIILLACVAACLAGHLEDSEWQQYKLEFGKVYTAEQEASKYATWLENKKGIDLHNADYAQSYKQGLNEFADMTEEEFKAIYLGGFHMPEEYLNGSKSTGAEPWVPPPEDAPIPNGVNWVNQGYVTGVKNQGRCGSCYSFSATGGLEGATYKTSGRLPSLSESQIVDCSGRYGNQGCGGGWYQAAWHYIRDCGGSQSEASYSYVPQQRWCQFNSQYVNARVQSWVDLPKGSERSLQQALATVGPIAIAIDASHSSFRYYRTGVYYEPQCSSSNLDHAVLAVGYGTEGGYDYWLVKNSWGYSFGQGGYIKMIRNYGNHCGVASNPSYVIAA